MLQKFVFIYRLYRHCFKATLISFIGRIVLYIGLPVGVLLLLDNIIIGATVIISSVLIMVISDMIADKIAQYVYRTNPDVQKELEIDKKIENENSLLWICPKCGNTNLKTTYLCSKCKYWSL